MHDYVNNYQLLCLTRCFTVSSEGHLIEGFCSHFKLSALRSRSSLIDCGNIGVRAFLYVRESRLHDMGGESTSRSSVKAVWCAGGAADRAAAARGGRGGGGRVRARGGRAAGGRRRLVPGRAGAPARHARAHLRALPVPGAAARAPRPRLPRRPARHEVCIIFYFII